MTHPAKACAIKVMTAEDRESLRAAQEAWASPEMRALFARWDLKEAVLHGYKRLRKCGQDPDSALSLALWDWNLV